MNNSLNSKKGIKELQSFLIKYGFDLKRIDGVLGKNTLSAVNDMIYVLRNPVKNRNNLTKKEVIKDITEEARIWKFTKEQIAYILATVKHETNNTFKPVKEAYWLSEQWREKNLRYYPFFGRGYVQITWKENYEKFSKILEMDLVSNPELVMKPDIALFILLYGFKHGTFTGKKIVEYIYGNQFDFIRARRCINGNYKAKKIAKYAEKYYKQLIIEELFY